MPAVPRPVVFFRGKGEKSMRVKCISCGNELNLDHGIFEDYSGPVKCFSCSAMMEVKSTGGEINSIKATIRKGQERGKLNTINLVQMQLKSKIDRLLAFR
jgi:ribosomal protein S27E